MPPWSYASVIGPARKQKFGDSVRKGVGRPDS